MHALGLFGPIAEVRLNRFKSYPLIEFFYYIRLLYETDELV